MKDLHTLEIQSLIFLITLKCPLECAHCIVESNPRRSEVIDTNRVLNLIDEAYNLGAKLIGFTGGEPFLRYRDLIVFYDRVKLYEMDSIIVTSSFFASTEKKAKQMLTPFADILMLGISTDSYHQSFVGLKHIQNTIRAAKSLGIKKVEVQVAHLGSPSLTPLLEFLKKDADDVTIRTQKIWPVGKAAKLLTDSIGSTPIDQLNLTCPMVGPVVMPDMKVHACCSSLLNLGNKNPLIIGDLNVNSLTEINKSMANNNYYKFIKIFGLSPILKMLKKNGYDCNLKTEYTDVCHLCYDLHKTKTTADYLAKLVSSN